MSTAKLCDRQFRRLVRPACGLDATSAAAVVGQAIGIGTAVGVATVRGSADAATQSAALALCRELTVDLRDIAARGLAGIFLAAAERACREQIARIDTEGLE